MLNIFAFLFSFLFLLTLSCNKTNSPAPKPLATDNTGKSDIEYWLTNPGDNILFKKQLFSLTFQTKSDLTTVIDVDTSLTYQSVDGFGNTLTGGSAILINRMDPLPRKALLKELFGTENEDIGISYLRISIGASDLSDRVFSYCDLQAGQTDPSMNNFSIDTEKSDLIPVLKEILEINPSVKIMGSPWSAPVWMKTNGSSVGGSLKPEYFDAYALYFVKYIKAMAAEGITVDAVTVQNEPLHDGNNPSMYMSAADQTSFIKNSLGPAFRDNGLTTKIVVYDHNADKPEYPAKIYSDPDAAGFVDGAAFHLYGGSISALGSLRNSFPSKNLYFTEQWIGAPGNLAGDMGWHLKNVIIGSMRNWCKCALEWNMASDPRWDPHTPGGCDRCLGTVTIDGNKITRNPAWYILAHAARFVRPGAVRVGSNEPAGLPNVAFRTAAGKKVLLVFNESGSDQNFALKFSGKYANIHLVKGSAATLIW
jgi:glucosylceramidase